MTTRVIDYLLGRGMPFLVLPFPPAHSPEETAVAHDVSTDELVRTIAFRYRFGSAIAVVPWRRTIVVDLVREALDDPHARPADRGELEALAPGCRADSLPPLGLWLRAPIVVDLAVGRLEQIVFPAGRPSALICMQRRELFRDDPYAVAVLTDASRDEAAAAGLLTPPIPPRTLTEEDLLPVHVVEQRRAQAEPARGGPGERTDVA